MTLNYYTSEYINAEWEFSSTVFIQSLGLIQVLKCYLLKRFSTKMYLALKMDLSIILTGADWNQQETLRIYSWILMRSYVCITSPQHTTCLSEPQVTTTCIISIKQNVFPAYSTHLLLSKGVYPAWWVEHMSAVWCPSVQDPDTSVPAETETNNWHNPHTIQTTGLKLGGMALK